MVTVNGHILKHKEFEMECKCNEHSKLISSISIIETDVKWLIADRKHQMARYDKRKSNLFKVKLAVASILFTGFGYLFKNKDVLKASLKAWLEC